jgi:rRNA maturation endonuclease Nob1
MTKPKIKEKLLFPNVCDTCGCANPSLERIPPKACASCGAAFEKVSYKVPSYNEHPRARVPYDNLDV